MGSGVNVLFRALQIVSVSFGHVDHATETGMKCARVFFALHAGRNAVANAVLVTAHERTAALHAFNDAGFLGIEAAVRSGWIPNRSK